MSKQRKISRTINATPEAFDLLRAMLRLKIMEYKGASTDSFSAERDHNATLLRVVLAQIAN